MLAIVAAFKAEVQGYLKGGRFQIAARSQHLQLYQSAVAPGVLVAVGAIGAKLAQEATEYLVERHGPDFILSVGFAGGVRPGLSPGDLFLCARLMSVDGPHAGWSPEAALERLPDDVTLKDTLAKSREATSTKFSIGGCLTVPEVATASEMKGWIGRSFPVDVVDMESFWVCERAAAHGIPHAAVRVVLDPMEQTLPALVREVVNTTHGRRWQQGVKSLARHPTQVPGLLRLPAQVRAASMSLGGFLAMLEPAAAETLRSGKQ